MAIDLATGFNIGSKDAIDERQVLTLEQMKNLDESIYPDKYFAICKDDSMLYVYNVINPVNAETGKFRKVGSNESVDPSIFQKINDDTLITEDKTIVGAINEISGTQLDTVSFSADYKNIILNRKSGLNPYTIPIASIINNASLAELKDIDSTDIGNGKILVYDAATQKHKYVNSSITDELVKMDSATDAKYLSNLIDKSTVVNDNGVLKVKKLDGQEVTITEINYLKGLTMNVMDLVSAFANGGVKVLSTPLNTASELDTMDRTSFIDGISYIVYVLADENHAGAKTTYLVDKTNTTFFGNSDSQRNFTTNPIDLANEVTGKLGTSNIDVDSLWTLLTINDTYKTLTTNNEIFGTHGAKAMYDELTTAIGEKANTSDIPTKTSELNNDSGFTTIDDNSETATATTLSANKINSIINNKLGEQADVNKVVKKIYIIDTSSEDARTLIQNHWNEFDRFEFYNLRLETAKWTWNAEIYAHTPEYGTVLLMSYGTDVPSVFYGKLYNNVWIWKELISTDNTKDVGVTTITPINSAITGRIEYTVKNGICYVSLFNVKSTTNSNGLSISTTMPKPAINSSAAIVKQVGSGNLGFVYINKNATQLMANINIADILGACSFSYPVAES